MSGKNAMWLTIIAIAAVFGAFIGPPVFEAIGDKTMMIAAPILLILFIGVIVWALSSNKRGVKADSRLVADARRMEPPAGKARIYVCRRGFVAALQGMNVTLDGTASGQIKSGQMLMADVDPGKHHLHVATAKASLARPAELEIDLGAGGVVVIHAMIEMGALKGDVKLTRLDAKSARENVHATKLMLWEATPA
jgi:hypothetical protein